MQYVTVMGNDHAEAIKKLREQYGTDAIIYGEKWVSPKSMLSKMVGKKHFQIEAAIREKKSRETKNGIADMVQAGKDSGLSQGLSSQSGNSLLSKSISELPVSSQTFLQNSNALQSEKNSMLNMIEKNKKKDAHEKSGSLESWKPNEVELLRNFISKMAAHSDKASSLYPQEFQDIYMILKNQDFTHNWIDSLLKTLHNELPRKQWNMFPVLYKKAMDIMASKIKTSSVFHKRAVALIGPTGVGKTTTVAKIAAWLKLKKDQNISLITLDNYRIAATEQLKVYANILDVPIHVCKDPKKMKNIFLDDNSDIFLIDNAGLSQKNNEFLMKQHDMLEALDYDIEKHLVLAANSKPEDIIETATAFSFLNFDRIIISKMDETNRFGHLIELSQKWEKPFSFFTTGQRVPDDYMIADARHLIDRVLYKWKQ